MQKWGWQFDGRDPISLERMEELKVAYGFPDSQMLKGLPELIKGDALLWHLNNRDDWYNWGHFEKAFCVQYLPRRYQAALRREAADRHQNWAKNSQNMLLIC